MIRLRGRNNDSLVGFARTFPASVVTAIAIADNLSHCSGVVEVLLNVGEIQVRRLGCDEEKDDDAADLGSRSNGGQQQAC